MAEAQRIPLGEAVSILARRGIPKIELKMAADGLPVLAVDPADFPRLTSEDVADMLADFP